MAGKPRKARPARRFSRSIAGPTCFIVGQPHRRIPPGLACQRAITALVHRRRPTGRRIVSPFPLQNRPAVSGVPIATSSARFSTRRFTICGTKRIHDFGIRAQFIELRRGQDARGPPAPAARSPETSRARLTPSSRRACTTSARLRRSWPASRRSSSSLATASFQAASSTVVMSQASAMAKLRRPRIPLNGYKNSSDSARIQR
jgi:hypothetical protein